jgi:hypothetical protein
VVSLLVSKFSKKEKLEVVRKKKNVLKKRLTSDLGLKPACPASLRKDSFSAPYCF